MLINSGFEQTVPLIRASVESLGFKMTDVNILLPSHAHSDHCFLRDRPPAWKRWSTAPARRLLPNAPGG